MGPLRVVWHVVCATVRLFYEFVILLPRYLFIEKWDTSSALWGHRAEAQVQYCASDARAAAVVHRIGCLRIKANPSTVRKHSGSASRKERNLSTSMILLQPTASEEEICCSGGSSPMSIASSNMALTQNELQSELFRSGTRPMPRPSGCCRTPQQHCLDGVFTLGTQYLEGSLLHGTVWVPHHFVELSTQDAMYGSKAGCRPPFSPRKTFMSQPHFSSVWESEMEITVGATPTQGVSSSREETSGVTSRWGSGTASASHISPPSEWRCSRSRGVAVDGSLKCHLFVMQEAPMQSSDQARNWDSECSYTVVGLRYIVCPSPMCCATRPCSICVARVPAWRKVLAAFPWTARKAGNIPSSAWTCRAWPTGASFVLPCGFIPPWYAVSARGQMLLANVDPLWQIFLELVVLHPHEWSKRADRRQQERWQLLGAIAADASHRSEGYWAKGKSTLSFLHLLPRPTAPTGVFRLLRCHPFNLPLEAVSACVRYVAMNCMGVQMENATVKQNSNTPTAKVERWASGHCRPYDPPAASLHPPMTWDACTNTAVTEKTARPCVLQQEVTAITYARLVENDDSRPSNWSRCVTSAFSAACTAPTTHGLILEPKLLGCTSTPILLETSTMDDEVAEASPSAASANPLRNGEEEGGTPGIRRSAETFFDTVPATSKTKMPSFDRPRYAEASEGRPVPCFERCTGVYWLNQRCPPWMPMCQESRSQSFPISPPTVRSDDFPVVVLLLCPSLLQGSLSGHFVRRMGILCEHLSTIATLRHEQVKLSRRGADRGSHLGRKGSEYVGAERDLGEAHDAAGLNDGCDVRFASWHAAVPAAEMRSTAAQSQPQNSRPTRHVEHFSDFFMAASSPTSESPVPTEEGPDKLSVPMTANDVEKLIEYLRGRLPSHRSTEHLSAKKHTETDNVNAATGLRNDAPRRRSVFIVAVSWSEAAEPWVQYILSHVGTCRLDGFIGIGHSLSSTFRWMCDGNYFRSEHSSQGALAAPLLYHSKLFSGLHQGTRSLFLLMIRLQLIAAYLRAERGHCRSDLHRARAGTGTAPETPITSAASPLTAGVHRNGRARRARGVGAVQHPLHVVATSAYGATLPMARASLKRMRLAKQAEMNQIFKSRSAALRQGRKGAILLAHSLSTLRAVRDRVNRQMQGLDPATQWIVSQAATRVTPTSSAADELFRWPQKDTSERENVLLTGLSGAYPASLADADTLGLSARVRAQSRPPSSLHYAFPTIPTFMDWEAVLQHQQHGAGGLVSPQYPLQPSGCSSSLIKQTHKMMHDSADIVVQSAEAGHLPPPRNSSAYHWSSASELASIWTVPGSLHPSRAVENSKAPVLLLEDSSMLFEMAQGKVLETHRRASFGATDSPLTGVRAHGEDNQSNENLLGNEERTAQFFQPRASSDGIRMTSAAALIELRVLATQNAALLSRFQIPTLLVHARDDNVVPFATVPVQYLAENSNVFMVLSRRGGHGVFMEGCRQIWSSPELVLQEVPREIVTGATRVASPSEARDVRGNCRNGAGSDNSANSLDIEVRLRIIGTTWIERLVTEFVASAVLTRDPFV